MRDSDLLCVNCGKPCGLQMLCAECSEMYRRGLLSDLERLMARNEPRLNRFTEWLGLLFSALIMGFIWWVLCVIWLGSR